MTSRFRKSGTIPIVFLMERFVLSTLSRKCALHTEASLPQLSTALVGEYVDEEPAARFSGRVIRTGHFRGEGAYHHRVPAFPLCGIISKHDRYIKT